MFLPAICLTAFMLSGFGHPFEKKEKTFTLSGKVKGVEHGFIYLLYVNETVGHVLDSAVIDRQNFVINGSVSEPTIAIISLVNPLTDEYYNSNSHADIYLEPGQLTALIDKDDFRALHITGSAAQQDQERLEKQKSSLWKLHYQSNQQENILRKERDHADGNRLIVIKKQLDSIGLNTINIERMMSQIDSAFIMNNRSSFVTAQLLKKNLQFENFLLYPVDSLFYGLPDSIQKMSVGKTIQRIILQEKKTRAGNKAYAFTGATPDGKQVSLSDFKGKSYVLLDFWGSWCIPCRMLNPRIKELQAAYGQKGLQVISIAVNDKASDWLKAIKEDSTGDWLHILDDETKKIGEQYSATFVPAFVLIDKTGTIAGRYGPSDAYGVKNIFRISGDLDKLLKEQEKN